MAKPVINTTSSVLGYLQWQSFEFQPAATNTPTSWAAVGLPTGLAINGATGLISGAAEKPGVYVVPVTATNIDGTSAPVIFTIGIEASAGEPKANVIDVAIDISTREVTGYLGEKSDPLWASKYRDDVFFRVRFHRNQAPCSDLDLSKLKIVLKDCVDDSVIAQSEDDDFTDLVGGVTIVYLSLAAAGLANMMQPSADSKAAEFKAICEFEWLAANTLGVGPETARGSSRTFNGLVIQDLNQLEA